MIMEKTVTPVIGQQQQKRIFISRVVYFIAHSKRVYLNSCAPDKTQKLNKCDMLLYEINKLNNVPSLMEAKRTVVRFKKQLFDILPHEKNKSYQSSMESFNDIMGFCQHEVATFIFNQG